MFLPVKFVHPVRTERWRAVTLPMALLWVYFAGWAAWVEFSPAVIGNKLMGTSPLDYTDFTPLNILAREYVVFAVRADSPIKTLQDLTARLKHPDLKSVVVAGALDQAAREAKGATADYTLDQISFDPVIANPSKLICIGVNLYNWFKILLA